MICENQEFIPLCGQTFFANEATVVCYQLGFRGGSKLMKIKMNKCVTDILNISKNLQIQMRLYTVICNSTGGISKRHRAIKCI